MKHIPDSEVQHQIADLLAIVATSDGSVSTEEIERLVVILQRAFGLGDGSALDLITNAIHDTPADHDPGRHLHSLASALRKDQKEDLIVMLLEVISADGIKEARELEILSDTAVALRIPDDAMDRAYRRYFEKRKGGPGPRRG